MPGGEREEERGGGAGPALAEAVEERGEELRRALGVLDPERDRIGVDAQVERPVPHRAQRHAQGEEGVGRRAQPAAAEIVSGAIQDHDRGLVIGETTFGKGLVQTVQPLSENTGLALTTARYYTPSGRLIQRDYKSISLYEYHYERKVPDHPTEIRQTDSGRQVTGGGGITPDILVAANKFNKFQELMFRSDVLYPAEQGVGGFTRYFLGSKPNITRSFEVDDNLLHEFRTYLSKHNIKYTEAEYDENLDWIKRKIKQEAFMSTYGTQEGDKVLLAADPQVQKAIESIPQARALYENARKVVAQRNGSDHDQP